MDEEGDLFVDVGERIGIGAGRERRPRGADLVPGVEDPFRKVAGGEGRRLEMRRPGREAAFELLPGTHPGRLGEAAFEDRPHDELVREPRRRADRLHLLRIRLLRIRPGRGGHREVAKGEPLHPAEGPSHGAELLAEQEHREAKEPRAVDRGRAPRPVEEAERDAAAPVLEGGVAPEADPGMDRVDMLREVAEAPGRDPVALEGALRRAGEAPGRLGAEPRLQLVKVAAAPEHRPAPSDDLESHPKVRGQEVGA